MPNEIEEFPDDGQPRESGEETASRDAEGATAVGAVGIEYADDEADDGAVSDAGDPGMPDPQFAIPAPQPVDGPPDDEPRHRRAARPGAAAGTGAALADGARGVDVSGEASFGAWLRRQREMREIDLREIADRTKISLRYLEAMEQDRFDILPAPVFARGFLREYARYVGLNPDDVVNHYLATLQEADGSAEEEGIPLSTASRGAVSKRFLVILVVVLLLAGAVYAYFYQRSRRSHEEAVPPPIAAPVSESRQVPPEPSPPPVAEAAPGAPLVVTLDFTQKCWVEAQVDGERRESKLFVAGESLQLEAQQRVVLGTLGNADGVQIQVNGEPYALPAPRAADGSVRDLVIEAPNAETGAAALRPALRPSRRSAAPLARG